LSSRWSLCHDLQNVKQSSDHHDRTPSKKYCNNHCDIYIYIYLDSKTASITSLKNVNNYLVFVCECDFRRKNSSSFSTIIQFVLEAKSILCCQSLFIFLLHIFADLDVLIIKVSHVGWFKISNYCHTVNCKKATFLLLSSIYF